MEYDNVFNNILNLLTINTTSNGSLFIISNAFMQYQGYGRDMIDGFGGLIQYIESEQGENFKIVDASLTHKDNMLYKNGCVVMKKING